MKISVIGDTGLIASKTVAILRQDGPRCLGSFAQRRIKAQVEWMIPSHRYHQT